jgi:hypothetical protein
MSEILQLREEWQGGIFMHIMSTAPASRFKQYFVMYEYNASVWCVLTIETLRVNWIISITT